MDKRGSIPEIDPLLKPFLQSSDETECERLLAGLISNHASPLIKEAIWFKLHASSLLPPTLSWILSGEEEQAADDAERQGLSWKRFKPELKIVEKGTDWMALEEPGEARISLEIKAFGDFNGDGIEDVLLFKSTNAIEGTFRYYEPVILTRTADGRQLKVLKVDG